MESTEYVNGGSQSDAAIHANGSSQADAASHGNGGGEIVAAVHSDGDPHPAPTDLKEAVASIGAQLSDSLQALSVHLGTADRMYAYLSERTQAITGVQEQVAAIQQELQGVQNFVRGLPDEVQTVRQQCEGKVDGVAERFEQRLQSEAQTVAGLGQQITATTRTLEDKAGQISSLEISVAALIRDAGKMTTVETTIADLTQKGSDLSTTVEDLVQRSQSLKRMTMLTSATALLLAVVVGMQMLGGWSAVARYVALLRSALS